VKRLVAIFAGFVVASSVFLVAAEKTTQTPARPTTPFPVAYLEGGRRIDFLRIVSSEQELHRKRSFFNRLVDWVAGAPEWRRMLRPYAVVTDSRGRLLVTDPGAPGVHIFDFEENKYTFLTGGKREPLASPIGIALDARDNIYVTDSRLGKILVFDEKGKYLRSLGNARGRDLFKRPTGIAIDKGAGRLYVADTLRHCIDVTDLSGNVLAHFGTRGSAPGEFNFPTEVFLHGDDLYVVDAMNFRVQIFDRQGTYRGQFGSLGDRPGSLFRPKGLGVDSEGNIYLVDASMEVVQVYSRQGQLLFTFGRTGNRTSEFELPSGLWIDPRDRIYVADSYNHRVQIFQFVSATHSSGRRK
jgi:DNA-binding beta-propeller fold protein YncE